jgi:hypothetical protein
MGRKIDVQISNSFEFDEEFLLENYAEPGEALSDNDLLEIAEGLINDLDANTILDTAFVEAVFYD